MLDPHYALLPVRYVLYRGKSFAMAVEEDWDNRNGYVNFVILKHL